ncbi:MAG TPA: methyltransferase domain-containing protein [Vicinamibacteria bacterium]|nr:methyltransferase domain-containing protein [Vicinamibacteria bacterium]
MGEASEVDGPPIRAAVPPRGAGPGGAESRLDRVLPYVFGRAPSPLRRLAARLLEVGARRRLATRRPPLRLCLGSGRAPIPEWVNIDLHLGADVVLDLTSGIPAPPGSVETVYSEHLIEHFSLEEGLALLRECRRVLEPAGILRIATPDLATLVDDYRHTWRTHDWVSWPEYRWVDSGARMLNQAFRGWGHLYLYDFEDLSARLESAGFRDVRRCAIGESEHPHLRGLETRRDSGLVVEASAGPGRSA